MSYRKEGTIDSSWSCSGENTTDPKMLKKNIKNLVE